MSDRRDLATNERHAIVTTDEGTLLTDSDGNDFPLDGRDDALSVMRIAATLVDGYEVVTEGADDDSNWTTDHDGEMAQVTFYPQVWSGDYAKTGDPVHYEVPLPDATDGDGNLLPDRDIGSDALKEHPNAPPRVRNHTGPFFVEVDR